MTEVRIVESQVEGRTGAGITFIAGSRSEVFPLVTKSSVSTVTMAAE